MKALTYALLGLNLAVQAGLWLPGGGVPQVLSLRAQVDAVQSRNAEARQRNEQLAAEVEDLKTGGEMIEELARYELGMIKPGEIFVQITPPR
jgi:cell division protein FtsB